MDQPRKTLPTDIGGAILSGLGMCMGWAWWGETHLARMDVVIHVVWLTLLGAGLGIIVVGRRRHRQKLEEIDETRQRGLAGRHIMPLGDVIATVIANCVVAFVLGSLVIAAGLNILLLGTGRGLQQKLLWQMGGVAVLLAVGVTGVLTWRRLREANRKLAEPLCPQCGYVLYGVNDRRCPNCGRPFDVSELNVSLLRIDEEGRLQPKETRR